MALVHPPSDSSIICLLPSAAPQARGIDLPPYEDPWETGAAPSLCSGRALTPFFSCDWDLKMP